MVLWHGCTQLDAQNIEANGIDLTRSRNGLDFGPGFYTTTDRGQADRWARRKHANLSRADRGATRPSTLTFRVPVDQLAPLESLMFVRGDAGHDAFWSFVHHCRLSTATAQRTHLRPVRAAKGDWYDVVCGPLAAVWPPDGREMIPDSDQFSFHTVAGTAILDHVINAGPPRFEIIVL
ncbi:MAG TPA: DUF3990 domain-containing protein [Gemmataceae bacterium]|nr:DUF3990 domain-containing protein [Gemmataceae bacterium]